MVAALPTAFTASSHELGEKPFVSPSEPDMFENLQMRSSLLTPRSRGEAKNLKKPQFQTDHENDWIVVGEPLDREQQGPAPHSLLVQVRLR